MIRQCAWCLRLIDSTGTRISQQPVPKLYEASHGMCSVCGYLWMDRVLSSAEPYPDPEEHAYTGRRMVAESSPARLFGSQQNFNDEIDT